MWGESTIKRSALFPLNMVSLTTISSFRIDRLHHIHAAAGAWERRDRWLEVAFLGFGLHHLMFSHWLLIIYIEVVISLPKSVLTCFICFAEIFLRFQLFRWIFLLTSETLGSSADHLGGPGESVEDSLLWVRSSVVFSLGVHDIVHGITRVIVLWTLCTAHSSLLWVPIHALVNSTSSSCWTWLINSFWTSLSYSCSWFRILHSTLRSDLGVKSVDSVFVQTDVFDVLPESINIPGGVKSSEIGWCCCWFFWVLILAWGRNVGTIWCVAAQDGSVTILARCLIWFLMVFHGWAKTSSILFESSWWGEVSNRGCLSRLLFNLPAGGISILVLRAVIWTANFFGSKCSLVAFMLNGCSLAYSISIWMTHWRRKPLVVRPAGSRTALVIKGECSTTTTVLGRLCDGCWRLTGKGERTPGRTALW